MAFLSPEEGPRLPCQRIYHDSDGLCTSFFPTALAPSACFVVGSDPDPWTTHSTAILRIMGLSADKHFQNYHRVLNRAIWSSREISRLLLKFLVTAFAASRPVLMGLDDTIERRRGSRSKPKAFTGIRCVPATVTSSKPVACAG